MVSANFKKKHSCLHNSFGNLHTLKIACKTNHHSFVSFTIYGCLNFVKMVTTSTKKYTKAKTSTPVKLLSKRQKNNKKHLLQMLIIMIVISVLK